MWNAELRWDIQDLFEILAVPEIDPRVMSFVKPRDPYARLDSNRAYAKTPSGRLALLAAQQRFRARHGAKRAAYNRQWRLRRRAGYVVTVPSIST